MFARSGGNSASRGAVTNADSRQRFRFQSAVVITATLLSSQRALWDTLLLSAPPRGHCAGFGHFEVWGLSRARRFLWDGSTTTILKWPHLDEL